MNTFDDSLPRLLMGNAAMGLAALAAGVRIVTGYPGTPSSEILETIAAARSRDVQVQWSTNEKAALEVAAGASYAGARALVTMKQVGLNVAADPLLSLNYVGTGGGLVLVVADDPGPISSQTEQDTRRFAAFAKVPVLDPSSVEEAAELIRYAFELSEHYHTPVIVRPTTRICHSYAPVVIAPSDAAELAAHSRSCTFTRERDHVIFPQLAYQAHGEINERLRLMTAEFSALACNTITEVCLPAAATARASSDHTTPLRGIVSGGISDAYVREALLANNEATSDFKGTWRLLKVATPYPFPEARALTFLEGLDEVLVFEELDSVLEEELLKVIGRHHLPVMVHGKLTGDTPAAGENSTTIAEQALRACAGLLTAPPTSAAAGATTQSPVTAPKLSPRPPALCVGCPHRASFTAVKRALKGQPAVFSGDIGCYTLGNAAPLNMVDTCLCMGAGITIAQGLELAESEVAHLAFIGDSTFFASGLTGVVNASYNQTNITLIILDNATTAMTGQQPHPGTGQTMMGTYSPVPDIAEVLRALKVAHVQTVDPTDALAATQAVREAVDFDGVSAVVFKAPCIYVPTAGGAGGAPLSTSAPTATSAAIPAAATEAEGATQDGAQ